MSEVSVNLLPAGMKTAGKNWNSWTVFIAWEEPDVRPVDATAWFDRAWISGKGLQEVKSQERVKRAAEIASPGNGAAHGPQDRRRI